MMQTPVLEHNIFPTSYNKLRFAYTQSALGTYDSSGVNIKVNNKTEQREHISFILSWDFIAEFQSMDLLIRDTREYVIHPYIKVSSVAKMFAKELPVVQLLLLT